ASRARVMSDAVSQLIRIGPLYHPGSTDESRLLGRAAALVLGLVLVLAGALTVVLAGVLAGRRLAAHAGDLVGGGLRAGRIGALRELEVFVERVDRLVVLVVQLVHVAEVVPGLGVIGLERDRRLVLGNRVLDVLGAAIHDGEVEVVLGLVRAELDRLLQRL